MTLTINEMVSEVIKALGLDRDKLDGAAVAELRGALDGWQDDINRDAYDEGYEQGESDAKVRPEFENVDHTTLNNLETGLSLLKNGDTLSAPVYLDRVLKDFGSSYY